MSELSWASELRFRAVNAESDGKKTFSVEPGKLLDLLTEHERAVARKDAALVATELMVTALQSTIAAQSLVIEKLKEQRDDLAHDAAYEINYGPHPKEALEKIKELDAELAALTKQPEPKAGA